MLVIKSSTHFVINSGKIPSFVSTLKILNWLPTAVNFQRVDIHPRTVEESRNNLKIFRYFSDDLYHGYSESALQVAL